MRAQQHVPNGYGRVDAHPRATGGSAERRVAKLHSLVSLAGGAPGIGRGGLGSSGSDAECGVGHRGRVAWQCKPADVRRALWRNATTANLDSSIAAPPDLVIAKGGVLTARLYADPRDIDRMGSQVVARRLRALAPQP